MSASACTRSMPDYEYHCCYWHQHHNNRFMALFLGPPEWAGARRELLDFMVQGKINRGRHTDHPAGRLSIWTNQCPPPSSPHLLQARCPSCRSTNSVKALKATSAVRRELFDWSVQHADVVEWLQLVVWELARSCDCDMCWHSDRLLHCTFTRFTSTFALYWGGCEVLRWAYLCVCVSLWYNRINYIMLYFTRLYCAVWISLLPRLSFFCFSIFMINNDLCSVMITLWLVCDNVVSTV